MDAEKIINKVGYLKTERANFETHWQEIADYILPRKNDIIDTKYPGVKRNFQVLDNTGMQSCELLAGALHSMLTNPTGYWFELMTGESEIDKRDDARKWFQETTSIMHDVFNQSNFQTEVHETYLDLAGFGTAPLFIADDMENVVNFEARFLKEVFICENNKGLVDEVYREFEWDVKKIIQEFFDIEEMKAKMPDRLKKCVEDNKYEVKFKIIHAVYPMKMYGDYNSDFKFCSKYILIDDKFELRKDFYYENPWIVPRWSKASGEVYGRSPGMTALPEVKTVNLMTETMIIGAQKTIDPPIMMPDQGFILPIKTKPGSINYRRSGSRDERIEPIFDNLRIDFGFPLIESHTKRIREAFFVDQLQLGSGPQMTATEVNQRTEEKMRLLAPMLGRMHFEFLRPLVDRVFGILSRKNLLPAPPRVLQGKELKVRYSSAIAKIQRMSEANNIMRVMSAVSPFVQMDQTTLDNFNGDAAIRGIAQMYSFPQDWLNDQDQVEEIRAQRAEQQQKAMEMQMQEAQAKAAGAAAPMAQVMQQAEEG